MFSFLSYFTKNKTVLCIFGGFIGLVSIVIAAFFIQQYQLQKNQKQQDALAVAQIKNSQAMADLKISTVKITQQLDKINSQLKQSEEVLDTQINALQGALTQVNSKKKQQIGQSELQNSEFTNDSVNTMEEVYMVWHTDYIKQLEQERYFLERANKRVTHFTKSHQHSMLYIDDLGRQNNELFNLFSPTFSKSIIQQNELLNFKLGLQVPKKQ